MWDSLWECLEGGQQLPQSECALALLGTLTAREPDPASVGAFLDSLDARRDQPIEQDAVNIVGAGGGRSTFNISTAAAFLAATLGVRVVKSGSRAYTSRYGSIDMLGLLGVPLVRSHEASAAALERLGIAFASSFVYPPQLTLLVRHTPPEEQSRLRQLLNRIGPFLAALPASFQLTGVAHGDLELLEHLMTNHCRRRVWLCCNQVGIDELVSFDENVIRVNRGPGPGAARELLGLRAGSPADLRPAGSRDGAVRQFTSLLAGEGPAAALESIALNAAALLVASDRKCDWANAFRSAMHALEHGHAATLLERVRRHEVSRARAIAPPRSRAHTRAADAPARVRSAIFDVSSGGPARLAFFLNAGDPSFEVLRRIVTMLDECGVDCLELAVPSTSVATDGAAIRRSSARAIKAGADLAATLAFVAALRPNLSHLKLILMVDWRHAVRAARIEEFLRRVQQAGCDGLLLYGAPPRVRPSYYESAHRCGVPIVATCFVSSTPKVMREAAANASAYLYLVSHYGTGEGAGRPDPAVLAPAIDTLRAISRVPIAVGFGIRTVADVRAVTNAGADAAIVGGAGVACLERAIVAGRDPVADMRVRVTALQDRATSA
jgi:tryptophan synthase alpha subunit